MIISPTKGRRVVKITGRSQLLFLPSLGICSQKTIRSIQKCLRDPCKIMPNPGRKPLLDLTMDTNQIKATEAVSTKDRSNKIIISRSQWAGQLSARKKEGYWWKNKSNSLPQIREKACLAPIEGSTYWIKVCIARSAMGIPAIMAIAA